MIQPAIFEDAGWYQGHVRLIAFDGERSRDRYKLAISRLEGLWPGAKLEVVSREDINCRPRARARLPAELSRYNHENDFLNNTKIYKAPGQDRVPYEFITNAPDSAIDTLQKAFNHMLSSGKVEPNFKKSLIFPIHKKGDCNLVANYRGISFMDCVAKTFAGVLLARLQII